MTGHFYKRARFTISVALLCCAKSAYADCPASNRYSFSFLNAPAQTLSYGSSYTLQASNGLGQTLNSTLSFLTNGLSATQVNSTQMPAINGLINDGTSGNNLMVGGIFSSRTSSITSGTRTITTRITFATAVRDVSIQLNDIDYNFDQYRDWIHLSGENGASTYVPKITTPFSNNNGSGPRTDSNSTVGLGSATTPFALSSSEGVGNGLNANTTNNGTIAASFVEPVTSITIRYGNYPLQSGEVNTGQQAFGIQSLSFCPMPEISLSKSSQLLSSALGGTETLMVPGAEVVYSLILSNANTSPTDASSMVITDLLPGQVIFRNSDFDGSGPITTNFEFLPGTSGLTLAGVNVGYSNNGGSTYTYSPAAGFDSQINAVRFSLQGAMAANSSATVRFRVRIK
jgi:hypothetical protein